MENYFFNDPEKNFDDRGIIFVEENGHPDYRKILFFLLGLKI